MPLSALMVANPCRWHAIAASEKALESEAAGAVILMCAADSAERGGRTYTLDARPVRPAPRHQLPELYRRTPGTKCRR